MRKRIDLYQKAGTLSPSKVWGTILDRLKENLEEVETQIKIPERVRISLALRECATLVEYEATKLGQVLEWSRFLQFKNDAGTEDKMRPRLADCIIDTDLRIALFKEIMIKSFVRTKLNSCEANKGALVEEWDAVKVFVARATEYPIVDEVLNTALADFIQAMDAPRQKPLFRL